MGLGGKLKDFLGRNVASAPVIKATMLGPRGVGKTSIMASIFSDTKENVAGTKLFFRPAPTTATPLQAKKLALMEVITKKESITDRPKAGAINATAEESTFEFEMGLKGREKTVDIQIKDYPGEWLESHPQEVSNFIAESSIVLVAIDTPYLMEEGGRYNESKNNPGLVMDYFRRHPDELKNKFVVLMPLKSELYFHQGRIDEVTAKVESVYAPLLEFCKANNIACAVTPIQTLGGVEFDRFVDNTDPFTEIPKISTFRFYGDNPQYMPMFCVQPLYYLLTYVANFYEWGKGQPKDFMSRLKDSLTSFLKNDEDFLHEIKKLSAKMMVEKQGYTLPVKNTVLNIK